jgi:hypothetical protein
LDDDEDGLGITAWNIDFAADNMSSATFLA